MATTKYTKQYFIEKFESLKDNEVGSGDLAKHCALFHCGMRGDGYTPTEEALALAKLFGYSGPEDDTEDYIDEDWWSYVTDVNDNWTNGGTPRQRILNKLYSLPD